MSFAYLDYLLSFRPLLELKKVNYRRYELLDVLPVQLDYCPKLQSRLSLTRPLGWLPELQIYSVFM